MRNNRLGLVDFGGTHRPIFLDLVPGAGVGDHVRVHVGFATERVGVNEAKQEYEQLGSVGISTMDVDLEAEERLHTNGRQEGTLELTRSKDEGTDHDSNELLTMILTYRVLRELEPDQLRKLLTIAEDRQFDAGQVIFLEGDKSLFFYLIVSGEVDLEDVSGSRPVRVQTLEAGDAMGWSSLTENSRTHFQSRALSPVSAIAFPGMRIREVCDLDPAMGYALTKRLLDLVTERLDATRIRVASGNATSQLTQVH